MCRPNACRGVTEAPGCSRCLAARLTVGVTPDSCAVCPLGHVAYCALSPDSRSVVIPPTFELGKWGLGKQEEVVRQAGGELGPASESSTGCVGKGPHTVRATSPRRGDSHPGPRGQVGCSCVRVYSSHLPKGPGSPLQLGLTWGGWSPRGKARGPGPPAGLGFPSEPAHRHVGCPWSFLCCPREEKGPHGVHGDGSCQEDVGWSRFLF